MGVCFLQLFDPSTPKASNRDPTSRDYLMSMKNIFDLIAVEHKFTLFEFVISWSKRPPGEDCHVKYRSNEVCVLPLWCFGNATGSFDRRWP